LTQILKLSSIKFIIRKKSWITGIRTRNLSKPAAADLCLRPRNHRGRYFGHLRRHNIGTYRQTYYFPFILCSFITACAQYFLEPGEVQKKKKKKNAHAVEERGYPLVQNFHNNSEVQSDSSQILTFFI